ncbi:MAG: 1-acyl-sn-glycerol-3-phosphate acyltransferase [Myxococcales bacterium]|nr:1-acyl-sn-glycerol-3-phosphate acyltransferase [Myxococcales bacterium]
MDTTPRHLAPAAALAVGTVLGGVLTTVIPPALGLALLVVLALGAWCGRPWAAHLAALHRDRHDRSTFDAIRGTAWSWIRGPMLLAVGLTVSAEAWGAAPWSSPWVAPTLLLAVSIGLAAGAWLGRPRRTGPLELGPVALGALLGGGAGLHLAWMLTALPPGPAAVTPPVPTALYVDLLGLGLVGGLMGAPLHALALHRTTPHDHARITTTRDVVHGLAMVVAAGIAIALHAAGLGVVGLLVLVAAGDLIAAAIAYRRLADRTLRLVISGIVRMMYRFRAPGIEHLPAEGPAVLVCNHISFVDPLLIGAASRRPVRFVMDHRIHRTPLLHRFFRTVGTIPIAPRHEDPEAFERAFERITKALREGELLCIFPEGKITHTGELNPFRKGIERILATDPVPVIPMALRGLWGSFFSRKDGPAMRKLPRRFRAQVELRCGEAIDPRHVSASGLQRRVARMLTA